MLGVVPVIRALREKAMNIQAETMESIDRKLPDLSEENVKSFRNIQKYYQSNVKRSIKQAKELSTDKK